jgi:hypothetical protein
MRLSARSYAVGSDRPVPTRNDLRSIRLTPRGAGMKRRSRAAKQPRIVSVELNPREKRRLDAVCDDRGMTIKSVLDRIVRWFAAASDLQQTRALRNESVLVAPRLTRGRRPDRR